MKRTIYFLSNDAVYDLTVAFLNSVRLTNGDAGLCLIPFDDRCERIRQLRAIYGFDIFGDLATLRLCDEISASVHGTVHGHYRKLACWFGGATQFAYIDVDTVVLSSLNREFELLRNFDVITAHSNLPSSRRWVWKDSTVPGDDLTQGQLEYAASTGFIASHGGMFTTQQLREIVPCAIRRKRDMELSCWEQPFLNYVIVKLTRAYSSLLTITKALNDDPTIGHECWAADKRWKVLPSGAGWYDDRRTKVLFVHWAGEWMVREDSPPDTEFPNIRANLPMRDIWVHYRLLPSAR